MRLWYNVQHHGSLHGLEALVSQLADETTLVDVSFDGDLGPESEALARLGPGVSVRRSEPVIWCGPSQITNLVQALAVAVESPEPWDYFINLSGACVLLRPNTTISASISTLHNLGFRAFVYGFKVGDGVQIVDEPSDDILYVHQHRSRVPIHMTPAAFAACGESSAAPTSPIRRPAKRIGLHCTEDAASKSLLVRGLTTSERADRSAILARYTHVCGKAWYILHRSVCVWLLDEICGTHREIYRVFRNSFEPDESFLPTIIHGAPNPWAEKVAIANFRLGFGKVMPLDELSVSEVAAAKGFFGRKLKPESDARLQLRALVESRYSAR